MEISCLSRKLQLGHLLNSTYLKHSLKRRQMVYYLRGRVEARHAIWEMPHWVSSFNRALYSFGIIQPIWNIPINTIRSCNTSTAGLELYTQYCDCQIKCTASTLLYIYSEQCNIFNISFSAQGLCCKPVARLNQIFNMLTAIGSTLLQHSGQKTVHNYIE